MSTGRSMSVSQMPAPREDCQLFPPLPRPAVCSFAMTSVPAGAPSAGNPMRDVERRSRRVEKLHSRKLEEALQLFRARLHRTDASLPAGVEHPSTAIPSTTR